MARAAFRKAIESSQRRVESLRPGNLGPEIEIPLQPPAWDGSDANCTQVALLEDAASLSLAETAGHIGTWKWDPVNRSHTISAELGRIFGVDVESPEQARIWAAHVWPEDWPKVQQLIKMSDETGTMEFEYRYLHPELGLRWLYCKGRRFKDRQGLFGIVQDVTARKAAEEASQRLAAIVESTEDAIISKDLNGIVTHWNPAAERMFGFTALEMVGRPITTIIPPELRADEARILAAIARGERIQHFETVRVKKNGDTIDVSLTVSPIKDEAGRIIGAAKVARDITEQKTAQRSLMMTERLAAVGRLAATVAHEINNPLEAITNLVYLAKIASPPGDVLRFLTSAEEQLASVSHLTRQTLGFYRETSGTRPVELPKIVDSLFTIFSSRAHNKGIELEQEIDSDLTFYSVPGEMRQVLANLVSNSVDAVPGPGRIRIRISAAKHMLNGHEAGIRITVADTGKGIAPHVRPRVFEPFFTTKRDVGTGLGLWVCKSIVDKNHGIIQIRSSVDPQNSWTVVSVFLPQSSAGEPQRQAA
ncbi:MAG TPA: PAS domain S-box protein [Terracidiphilus sp.]|nr:PAS domain S-box protein [Terracidiphilus sp.]